MDPLIGQTVESVMRRVMCAVFALGFPEYLASLIVFLPLGLASQYFFGYCLTFIWMLLVMFLKHRVIRMAEVAHEFDTSRACPGYRFRLPKVLHSPVGEMSLKWCPLATSLLPCVPNWFYLWAIGLTTYAEHPITMLMITQTAQDWDAEYQERADYIFGPALGSLGSPPWLIFYIALIGMTLHLTFFLYHMRKAHQCFGQAYCLQVNDNPSEESRREFWQRITYAADHAGLVLIANVAAGLVDQRDIFSRVTEMVSFETKAPYRQRTVRSLCGPVLRLLAKGCLFNVLFPALLIEPMSMVSMILALSMTFGTLSLTVLDHIDPFRSALGFFWDTRELGLRQSRLQALRIVFTEFIKASVLVIPLCICAMQIAGAWVCSSNMLVIIPLGGAGVGCVPMISKK